MCRSKLAILAIAAGGLSGAAAPVSAQVAFVPQVGAFPSGVSLAATPVVSADRRYVRLTLAPQFTALEGFTTLSVPGAVSGSGLRSVVPGPSYVAGMDGVIGPSGYGGYASPDLRSYGSGAFSSAEFASFSDDPPPARVARKPARGTSRARSKRSRPAPRKR